MQFLTNYAKSCDLRSIMRNHNIAEYQKPWVDDHFCYIAGNMSGQHCENYDVKRETVHCYPRNVDCCCTWSEHAESWCCRKILTVFFKICFCFVVLYNKSLNDWSLESQSKILRKQTSLFPSGPVIKCLVLIGHSQ